MDSKAAVGAEGRGMKAAGVLGTEPVQDSGDTLADMAYYTGRTRKDYSPWAWAFGNTWWEEEHKKAGLVNQTLENETYNNYSKMKFFQESHSMARKNSCFKVLAREKCSILLLIEMQEKSVECYPKNKIVEGNKTKYSPMNKE